ncbi:hypothetical protein [Rhodococcus zopfii]|uniref:hypothetical protein n=1 Tax=Rhodococcus zopfii TaxID=43772 RepID=UPI001473BCA2|nr:hypothetical protein [Rhodococcus zopfii]
MVETTGRKLGWQLDSAVHRHDGDRSGAVLEQDQHLLQCRGGVGRLYPVQNDQARRVVDQIRHLDR